MGGPQDRSGQVRKISPLTGIRSPDCPAPSQWLYRLRYRAHFVLDQFVYIIAKLLFVIIKCVSCSVVKDSQITMLITYLDLGSTLITSG